LKQKIYDTSTPLPRHEIEHAQTSHPHNHTDHEGRTPENPLPSHERDPRHEPSHLPPGQAEEEEKRQHDKSSHHSQARKEKDTGKDKDEEKHDDYSQALVPLTSAAASSSSSLSVKALGAYPWLTKDSTYRLSPLQLAAFDRHQQRYYTSPCYPRDVFLNDSLSGEGQPPVPVYFTGSSNFSACLGMLRRLIPVEDPCYTRSCSFAGVYQPRLMSNRFVAISYFTTSVVEQLGLPGNSSLAAIHDMSEKVCTMNWDELRAHFPDADLDLLPIYCVNSVWVYALLTRGFTFAHESKSIEYIPDPGQIGAILYEVNTLPWDVSSRLNPSATCDFDTRTSFSVASIALTSVLGALLLMSGLYIMRLRKQLTANHYVGIPDAEDGF